MKRPSRGPTLDVGRSRELTEWTNFQLAIAEAAGVGRINLRQGWKLPGMFKELPEGDRHLGLRTGHELVAEYETLHAEEDPDLTEAEELRWARS
jgi:hypothetical protein